MSSRLTDSRFRLGASSFCLLGILSAAWAAPLPPPDADTPRVALPLLSTPPTIDGVIDEAEWAGAVRNVGFAEHSGGTLSQRQGAFWVGCDGKSLFLALKTEAPPDGSILNRAVPGGNEDVKDAFNDDSIELVLDPKRGRTTGNRAYYHLITNGNGALYDLALDPDNAQNPVNMSWRLQGWTFKSQVKDNWWHAEFAIPLASLDATAEDLKTPWGIRIARNWRRPMAQTQWENRGTDYNDQGSMPIVTWEPAAPVVQVLSLGQGTDAPDLRVSVRNPHATPLPVTVFIADTWHRNPPSEFLKELTLPPGGMETVTVKPPDGGADGLHHTVIRVSGTESKPLYYFRDVTWSLRRPKEVWNLSEDAAKAVSLLFKYYPYHNRIRVRVDAAGLPGKDSIAAGAATIGTVAAPGAPAPAPVWQGALTFENGAAEGIFPIPDLANGRYLFSVQLRGGKDVPDKPLTQTFVRQHFEWEHNDLGKSDQVMPPFTPLTVTGDTVGCVLREHKHSADGLWSELRSQGRPLLTGPLTWAVTGGPKGALPQPQPVGGRGWNCTAKSATGVTGEATWTAGALTATVKTEYDYDGMMQVTLALEPTGTFVVHKLSLLIPLADAEAPYMHAVGDGLRFNYAGFVPAGSGKVWDSSKGNKLDITNTFFPYLWVGGGERGLAWFADNDRDWILDGSTPVLELVRDAGTLMLRVHIITQPGAITRQQVIRFGLQATPTKPMPDGWRRWVANKNVPGGRNVAWLGSTYYWGGISYDVVPWDSDFRYWDELGNSRRTGQISEAFLEYWRARMAKAEGKGTDQYKFLDAHLGAGFRTAAGSTWSNGNRLFGYTNARGIGFQVPEFATFQDEWLRFNWFNRDWDPKKGANAYDVSPSESFVDYAVWHYKKMIDTWTDGVYWDNTFFSAHYDPVVGNAWTDAAGKVHPGMGLFHLRNLIKRTAIMHWQAAKNLPASRTPLISLSHMTNTMIVPVLAFGNCNMDWEWKYGYTDFQDRFTADFTVAETIGRQVGAWGTILAGGHHDDKDPRSAWLWRTRRGVCLVHEIHNFDYRPKEDNDLYAKLFEFGYGLPDCRVFNYWDKPGPVTTEGADVRTLVMARGGAAMVVVVDYGEGGACEVTADLAALGLSAETAATDLETGAAVDRTGPGRFRFELKKHDYKVLRIK